MKKTSIAFTLLSFTQFLLAQTGGKILLEGHYQGYNLYIQNPYDGTGKDFCTKKVVVNGKEIPVDSTKASAFAINLSGMGFSEGDSIHIEIFHAADCKPKVLNPGPHPGKKSLIFNVRIESDSILKWEAKRNEKCMPFSVQQFRWNKWVKWEEVACSNENAGDTLYYLVNIKKYLHSGKNQFRVCQDNFSGPTVTKTISLEMPEEKELSFRKKGLDYYQNPVDLGKITHWELYDHYGNLLKKGYGQTFFIKDLKPQASYFLNYDNKTVDLIWY